MKIKYFVLLSFLFFHPTGLFAKLNVVTTTSDLAAIAKEIGGDAITVDSIAKGYQNPHFIDAKPSYILKLRNADLFIQIGLELEIGWAPALVMSARNNKILPGNKGFLEASKGCDILDMVSGSIDRSVGDAHPFGNPHYWLDPRNGRIIARNIAARLKELDPSQKDVFENNYSRFDAALQAKEKSWAEQLASVKGSKVVFYHNSWSNFAKWVGLHTVDFIEPKPGIPPSPAHVESIINKIKAEQVKVILVEPFFDLKMPDKIGRDTGAKVIVFPSSVGALPGINTYADLFDFNVKLLMENLTPKGDTK